MSYTMSEDERLRVRLASQVVKDLPMHLYGKIYKICMDIELTPCAQENLKRAMRKLRIKQSGLRSIK